MMLQPKDREAGVGKPRGFLTGGTFKCFYNPCSQ